MEGGTVESSTVRRMDVLARSAPPFLAARHELDLDDTLRAEQHAHIAVGILARGGHDHADRALQGGGDVAVVHDLTDVRRADLFLSLGDEYEVYGQLFPGTVDRVERGEECGLRT